MSSESSKLVTMLFGVLGGIGIGTLLGLNINNKTATETTVDVDQGAREALIAEIQTLTSHNVRQQAVIETSETTITSLSNSLSEVQIINEEYLRELELYRRIESGGLERGMHVDGVKFINTDEGPTLRASLLQVGGRQAATGTLGVVMVGASLPNATDGRIAVADNRAGTSIDFAFWFVTQIDIPLPSHLSVPDDGSEPDWLGDLESLEFTLKSSKSTQKPTLVTVPGDKVSLGSTE